MAFASPPPPPPPSNTYAQPLPIDPSSSSFVIPARRRRAPTTAFNLPQFLRPKTVFVAAIRVIDKKELPQSVVETHFAPLLQRTVTPQHITQAVDAVNEWFKSNGYVCSRLVVLKSPGWVQNTLILYSIEPVLASFRIVAVDKDGKDTPKTPIQTNKVTVINILGGKLGKVFRWYPDRFDALMSLTLFEYATAEMKPIDASKVELVLRVCERPRGRVEPGAGITSDGRVYGNLSVVDNNLFGRAQRLRMEWEKKIDSGRFSGGIAFENKRLGASIPISIMARAYRDSNSGRSIPIAGAISRAANSVTNSTLSQSDANDAHSQSTLAFEKDRDGAMIELSYQPRGKHVMFSVAPMLELVHSTQNASNGATPQFVLQTALSHLTGKGIGNPRGGHLIRLENYIGKHLSQGQESFHRSCLRIAKYCGIGPLASIAVGASFGYGSRNLPWHEQKSLGGYGTVRGYNYGELGRYKSYGVGRIELRVPLTAPLQQDSATSGDAKDNDGESDQSPATETTRRSILPPGVLQNLPDLVGVMFRDVAATTNRGPEVVGHSFGLGLRIGGIIALEWTQTEDGKGSRLHFGLVDQLL